MIDWGNLMCSDAHSWSGWKASADRRIARGFLGISSREWDFFM